MPRTNHTLSVSCPIPSTLTPTDIIAALHNHTNLVTLQPLVVSYDEVTSTHEYEPDPYFDPSSSPIRAYEIVESVIVIPGVGNWGRYPVKVICQFQNTEDGVKSRAVASAGVVLRATYHVHRSPSSSDDNEIRGYLDNASEWTLTEEATVECSNWLMPFVKQSMEGAHKDICQHLLNKIHVQLTDKVRYG
ncbi:hypothetical protein BP6252_11919 [Coleophoma cylindrospora]|uniref:DUF7053 domain-containing protein n=1 Tax=Coleophoma cylindrospora TaxID=1849047 RepID=A0A3D8QFA7_9HELO|nr:hypothetical protein BP6252_11919 [Coleophoma cylindrospora]